MLILTESHETTNLHIRVLIDSRATAHDNDRAASAAPDLLSINRWPASQRASDCPRTGIANADMAYFGSRRIIIDRPTYAVHDTTEREVYDQ